MLSVALKAELPSSPVVIIFSAWLRYAFVHVQGTASQWDWRRVQQQLLTVHLSSPGLQLRLLSKLEEVAAHLINTARVRDSSSSSNSISSQYMLTMQPTPVSIADSVRMQRVLEPHMQRCGNVLVLDCLHALEHIADMRLRIR
jgi:hypothetical protein